METHLEGQSSNQSCFFSLGQRRWVKFSPLIILEKGRCSFWIGAACANQVGSQLIIFLLHCPITRDLWDMVFTLFGVCWVMPKRVEDLLACWAGRFGKGEAASIWKIIPHCLMWNIWCERNAPHLLGWKLLFQL
jgi:hypothetical protein